MGSMAHLIEIKNATVYRGQQRVFDRFSLTIPQHYNTAILGPNGAGKSTLLKLLFRELYPVYEEDSYVRILGQEQWNVWDLRAHLGIVSHDLQQQYLGIVLGQNVVASGLFSSVDTPFLHLISDEESKKAKQVMETLGITALQNRMFGEMSTGEQRRFLLGRALINDP